MRDLEGRDYNSSARLDATTATLMVDREMLRTVLSPLEDSNLPRGTLSLRVLS